MGREVADDEKERGEAGRRDDWRGAALLDLGGRTGRVDDPDSRARIRAGGTDPRRGDRRRALRDDGGRVPRTAGLDDSHRQFARGVSLDHGEAATGVKGIVPALDPGNTKATDFLDRFRERYDYTTLEWYMGSAYDDVYITAACLAQTGDDQDAAGFRDCLYGMSSYVGTIGTYSFDSNGEVVGLSNAVAEVLPLAERTSSNAGWKILGPAPILP